MKMRLLHPASPEELYQTRIKTFPSMPELAWRA
jgi:hypothetical protein